MKETDRIIEIAAASETLCTELVDLHNAMQIFDESLEDECYQPEGKIENWQAVCFARRYPLYQGTFRVICRELERITGELKANTDLMYSAAREEKELNS